MKSVEYVHLWWVLRAWSRNPLVRPTDRLELLIIALGILVSLVAAACAGALGTAVHDERTDVYIAQAQTRHTVTAKATDDSSVVLNDYNNMATTVNVRWQVNGIEHTGSVNWPHAVETGDSLTIWVDRDGNRVDAPTPTSQASVDAVGVAYSAWQTVALAVAGSVYWGRRRLDRRRESAWEHDVRCLIDNDGGRTNRNKP
jgi:hypothetical protein